MHYIFDLVNESFLSKILIKNSICVPLNLTKIKIDIPSRMLILLHSIAFICNSFVASIKNFVTKNKKKTLTKNQKVKRVGNL